MPSLDVFLGWRAILLSFLTTIRGRVPIGRWMPGDHPGWPFGFEFELNLILQRYSDFSTSQHKNPFLLILPNGQMGSGTDWSLALSMMRPERASKKLKS